MSPISTGKCWWKLPILTLRIIRRLTIPGVHEFNNDIEIPYLTLWLVNAVQVASTKKCESSKKSIFSFRAYPMQNFTRISKIALSAKSDDFFMLKTAKF